MGDLSAHFSLDEFRDHESGAVIDPPCALIAALENLRGQGGNEPLAIISGYRTPEHNAAVGGAPDSRHTHGDAADVEGGRFTVDQALAAGFTGIGHEGGYIVHVDVRPGPPVVFED